MIPQGSNVCKASTDISKATVSPSAKPPPKFAATSVADPDVYPGSRADLGSRIPDSKQQQKRRVKKICCPTFFLATNITKLKFLSR
jgi:hypothetical protein